MEIEAADYPAEVWLHVFLLLDVPSLCIVPRVCKTFHELANIETIWKEKCMRLLPSQTLSSLSYLLQKNSESKKSKWKQLFQLVSSIEVDLDRIVHISFDDVIVKSELEHFHPHTSLKIESSILGKDRSCIVVRGAGQAPWGLFEVIGCGYGTYYSYTHYYPGSSELGVFSNYFGEVSLGNEFAPGSWMKGYWKSTWQNASGGFISFDNYDASYYEQQSDSMTNAMKLNLDNLDAILATWDATITIDNAFRTPQSPDEYHIRFQITNRRLHGLKGAVTKHDILPLKGGMVRGNIMDNMASFTIAIDTITITVVCELSATKEGKWLEGRVAMEREEYRPESGRFRARAIASHKNSDSGDKHAFFIIQH